MKALSIRVYVWAWRMLVTLALLGALLLAAVVLALRYWILPDIERYRADIAAAVSNASGQRVTIGSVAADWSGVRPHLRLGEVNVSGPQGQAGVRFERVEAVLSWKTLLVGEPRLHSLELMRPKLALRREPDGLIYVSDIALNHPQAKSTFADWLMHQERVQVSWGEVTWEDKLRQAPALTFRDVGFRLDNFGRRHRFGFIATPPEALSTRLDLRGDMKGRSLDRLSEWSGELFAELGQTNLAAWAPWIDFPYQLRQGEGSVQAWLTLKKGKAVGVTADLRLSEVKARLAKSLPELAFARLSGRVGWHELDRGFQFEARRLALDGAEKIRLAPLSLLIKYQAADAKHREAGEVQLEGIALEPLMQITEYLPLASEQREVLAELEPRGQFKRASLKWDGPFGSPENYTAHAEFANIGLRPYNKLPGFANVSGSLDADTRGGKLSLVGKHAVIDMPLVLRYPLGFDQLEVGAGWRQRDGRLQLNLTKVSLANSDVAGAFSGSYQSDPAGPGIIDLKGELSRANARAVHLYLPRVIGESTYEWVRDAVASGSANEVTLRLKGDLRHFPFVDERDGVFHVTAKGKDIDLRYAPEWPIVENAAATLDFRGKRMEVAASQGSISGVQISRVKAVIPDLLVFDELLELDGEAQGATQDALQFVAHSPVAAWIDHFADKTKADGKGRLGLRLRLPLRRLDQARVSGNYQFFNNAIRVDPAWPLAEQVSGRLDFTQDSVSVPRLSFVALGGPGTVTVATLPDQSLKVNASGQFTAQGLRTAYPSALTQALKGGSTWSLGVGMRRKLANVTFTTSLQGLESNLPEPLSKSASESLPLRVERRVVDAQQDRLSISFGQAATAQLVRQAREEGMQVHRGTVRLGGIAPEPVQEGVWLDGELPYLDLDAWRAVLLAGGSDGPSLALSGVNVKLTRFDFLGRRFNQLQLNGSRQGDLWQATVNGDEVAGEGTWRSEGGSKFTARLKRLAYPDAAPDRGVAPAGGVDLELPALDVIVEDLELGKLKLGRLELQAEKKAQDWHIDQLRIVNPDAMLSSTGSLLSWLAHPATKLDLDLEVKDVGKFLERMGYPDRVRRGTATLKGSLTWRGGPAAFNLESLSGEFRLTALNGQFVKVEPGIGKLLGLLSLQSLPRRLSLDFRDVFSDGFAFDTIVGSMLVTNGVVATNDFVMQGPAAVVNMSGVTDLAKETQNLRLTVVPVVGEGVAVAGAVLGGPIVGVTAYVLQQLLKNPVGKIVSHEYQVTGSWDNPQLSKVVSRGRQEAVTP
jgi:uncharacterized protein (TIGR02099 family)